MDKVPQKKIRVPVDKRNRLVDNPKKNKSTNIETDKRINIVLEMMLSGLSRWQILQNIDNNEQLKWGVSVSQIDKYMSEANKIMKKYAEKTKEEHFAKALNRYNFVYQKLIKVKDYKGAKDVIKNETELLGINAPTKTEITGKNGKDLIPSRPIIVVKTDTGDIL
jgi:hypothetical protein